MANQGTATFFTPTVSGTETTDGPNAFSFTPQNYINKNGFDLIWSQAQLQGQMGAVEQDIRDIEQNANLSDTEKMFSMQMAMNTWSAISLARTNEMKSVSDTLKAIVRNIN